MQDNRRDTDVKNRLLDSVGEGEGGMIWENSTETYLLPYVKQITSPSLVHETGHWKQVYWDNLEGRGEEGGERGVQDGGTRAPMADSYQWLAKNHHNIVK